jgi:hypothetical protein
MKLTQNLYNALCNKYKSIIRNRTDNIAEQLTKPPQKINTSEIVDDIYDISDAKDKLESLKDFWRYNDKKD